MRRRSKFGIALLAVIGVVVAARLAAPFLVERYVNRTLASMGDYHGHVASVDLALWRGGYVARDITVVKSAAPGPGSDTPFATMPQMDITLQWPALFHGRLVGEIVMFSPVLNLVQAESDEGTQLGTNVSWTEKFRNLFPFKLNTVEVENGLVTFRAPGIAAEESLTLRDFQVLLRNLTNVNDVADPAFADIALMGQIMGNAPIELSGRINPNAEEPTFDVNFGLENARLVDVNPWLRRYLKAEAQDGVFALYSELAAANGHFEGYVKPLLQNPKFSAAKEQNAGPLQRVWEAVVGLAAKIFQNRQKKQVATEIPLSGNFDSPRAGVLPAFVNLVRNAFVAAFTHSIEGSISLRDVGEGVTCPTVDGQPSCGNGDGARANDKDKKSEQPTEQQATPNAPREHRKNRRKPQ